MRDKIRFERCTDCENKKPHGYFYKGKDIQLPVIILSLTAGHHLMNLMPKNFEGQQNELEMDIWQAGLPEKVTGDVEIVDACMEDMKSLEVDPLLALFLLASLLPEGKSKNERDN
jgi:hypothetical protein